MIREGDGLTTNGLHQGLLCAVALVLTLGPQTAEVPQPHVVEILADHDSRFKMPGLKEPVVTVHAGELVTLRITALNESAI